MKTIVYKQLNPELIKEWQSLWKSSTEANYVNSPQWFLSAIDTFNYKDIAIIALYQKDKLVGIVGLVQEKKYGITFYTIAPIDFTCGVPFLIDINDEVIVKELIKQLLQLGNIFLNNIPEEFEAILQKNTKEMSSAYQTVNYFLPIQKDEKGNVILKKRNKLLKEIKGYEDKINLKTFDGTSNEGLTYVYKLDNVSRKQGKGYNTFASVEIRKFYENLAKYFKKNILINILFFEKTPIAYEIGFLIGKNYFGSQMAYVTDYKHYSPGKVILTKVIDYVGSNNVEEMSFGSGENTVKRLVTEQKRDLYKVILSKNLAARKYSHTLEKLKNYAFDQSYKYPMMYTTYRKIKKSFSK
ncbi:MAG TPA: GNAT family N-acetyltransferase [Candidatus Saccharimonadales bacterium]|nr:GNAT family N-acetyltransferase [Candidatus Saccharimonadales bacterium]